MYTVRTYNTDMDKTPNTTKVLAELARAEQHGLAIAHATGIAPPTVYRVLASLVRDGWAKARDEGPRKVYALTNVGKSWATAWATPNPAEPARYRRRVTVVRAVQWTGTNLETVLAFGAPHLVFADDTLTCMTLHGPDVVAVHDWLVEGAADDVYPVRPGPFAEIYEPA